jgi:hypothetical protein
MIRREFLKFVGTVTLAPLAVIRSLFPAKNAANRQSVHLGPQEVWTL